MFKDQPSVFIQSKKEMFVMLSTTGRILMVNEIFQNLTYHGFSESKGEPFIKLLETHSVLPFINSLNKVIKEETEQETMLMLKNKFKENIEVKCRMVFGKANIYMFLTTLNTEEFIIDNNHIKSQKILASRFNSLGNTPMYLL